MNDETKPSGDPVQTKVDDWTRALQGEPGVSVSENKPKRGPGRPKGSTNAPKPEPEPGPEWTAERVRKGIELPLRIICQGFGVSVATPEELQNLAESLAPAVEKHKDKIFGEHVAEITACIGLLIFAAPRYGEWRAAHEQPEEKTETRRMVDDFGPNAPAPV